MKDRNLEHSDKWETPDWFLKQIRSEFGDFFDPCPIDYDGSIDGLLIDWGKVNFVNPPYSRKLKEAFVKKAILESTKGKKSIMLLPVSTSTRLFHEWILPNAKDIRFIKGRIKFKGVNTFGEYVEDKSPMHDSMLVIF